MRMLGRVAVPSWFVALMAVSALLLLATQLSYMLVGRGSVSAALFWLGLGGENNIGSWWSGMLLALGAVLAFDGGLNPAKSSRERRGWCALGLALLLLSFDEVASLHEYLSSLGKAPLALLGVVGLALVSYSLVHLHRSGVSRRQLGLLLAAFGLLATVPIHEFAQQGLEWRDPVVYGLRAVLEEGTEVTAMLLFIWVLRANSLSLLRSSASLLAAPDRWRRLISASGFVLWPVLTAATFVLPQPGGPADWLASLLFLLCALLVARTAVLAGRVDTRSKALFLFYVGASAAANAVDIGWNPVVLGAPVSLRGVVLAVLVLVAAVLLATSGRRMKVGRALLIAAVIAASAALWSTSQLIWCGLPPLFALWLFTIESKGTIATSARAATAVPTAA